MQRFDGVVRAFLVLNACQRLLDIDGKGKGLVDQGFRGRNFFRRSRCCGGSRSGGRFTKCKRGSGQKRRI